LVESLIEDAICLGARKAWALTKWITPKAVRITKNVAKRGAKAAIATPVGQVAIQMARETAVYLTHEEPPPKRVGGSESIVVLILLLGLGGWWYFANHQTNSESHLPSMPLSPSSMPYRSVDEAQKAAVQRYPDLAVAGSTFNSAFIAKYRE
jgi:hypothetical protein